MRCRTPLSAWRCRLGAVVLLAACGSEPPPTTPAPTPEARVRRVVSLAPEATRFAIRVGARDVLVALDAGSRELGADLAHLPVATAETAPGFSPQLVLVGRSERDALRRTTLEAAGLEVATVAPHDLLEALELCRELGARLGGSADANRLEYGLSRGLAAIGGSSFGRPRPRVAGVLRAAPLELAGGHSFVTDLIQIAGGTSVTHDDDAPRLAPSASDWLRYAPDLLLFVSERTLSESERRSVRARLAMERPLLFLAFDPARWVDELEPAAGRLHAALEPWVRAREQVRDDPPR